SSRPLALFRSAVTIVRYTPSTPPPMRRWPYILVVDDDADFRSGLRIALEMKGYQVDEAANGEEALLKLGEKPPLLVLLDLQMPVIWPRRAHRGPQDGRGRAAPARIR